MKRKLYVAAHANTTRIRLALECAFDIFLPLHVLCEGIFSLQASEAGSWANSRQCAATLKSEIAISHAHLAQRQRLSDTRRQNLVVLGSRILIHKLKLSCSMESSHFIVNPWQALNAPS